MAGDKALIAIDGSQYSEQAYDCKYLHTCKAHAFVEVIWLPHCVAPCTPLQLACSEADLPVRPALHGPCDMSTRVCDRAIHAGFFILGQHRASLHSTLHTAKDISGHPFSLHESAKTGQTTILTSCCVTMAGFFYSLSFRDETPQSKLQRRCPQGLIGRRSLLCQPLFVRVTKIKPVK